MSDSDRGVHTTATENDRQLGTPVDGSRRSLSKHSPEKLRKEIDREKEKERGKGEGFEQVRRDSRR